MASANLIKYCQHAPNTGETGYGYGIQFNFVRMQTFYLHTKHWATSA